MLIIQLIHRIRKAENAGKVFWYIFAFLILLNVLPYLNYTGSSHKRTNHLFRPDYLVHFIMLFCLAWQYVYWKHKIVYVQILKAFKAFLYGLLLAILIEYIQKLIPGRSFNPVDLTYNLAGYLAGCIAALIYFRPKEE